NNPATLLDPDGCAPSQADIRKQVAREFILEKHMGPIEAASIKHNFAVSFRSAGVATIHALSLGAAAKGHDILEKTIKTSSLMKHYPDTYQDVYSKVQQAGILGYVGHWEQGKGLTGIYMSSNHSLGDRVIDRIYPINMNDLQASLEPLKRQPNWQSLPYTGDYDTHDMINLGGAGRPHTVLVGSPEEKRVINSINRGVANVDEYRPYADVEHNVIRHGPQVNFVSYMMTHEAGVVKEHGGSSAPLRIRASSRWRWCIKENGQLLKILNN
ncbi:TPA: Insecticial toxin, partial [Klebsiella aerogenes]|nr:Insecticial toxin [Klebsiella aerogenes]